MPVMKDFEMISMETIVDMIEGMSFGVPQIKTVDWNMLWDGIMVNGEPFLSIREIENCMGRHELKEIIRRKIEQVKERAGCGR